MGGPSLPARPKKSKQGGQQAAEVQARMMDALQGSTALQNVLKDPNVFHSALRGAPQLGGFVADNPAAAPFFDPATLSKLVGAMQNGSLSEMTGNIAASVTPDNVSKHRETLIKLQSYRQQLQQQMLTRQQQQQQQLYQQQQQRPVMSMNSMSQQPNAAAAPDVSTHHHHDQSRTPFAQQHPDRHSRAPAGSCDPKQQQKRSEMQRQNHLDAQQPFAQQQQQQQQQQQRQHSSSQPVRAQSDIGPLTRQPRISFPGSPAGAAAAGAQQQRQPTPSHRHHDSATTIDLSPTAAAGSASRAVAAVAPAPSPPLPKQYTAWANAAAAAVQQDMQATADQPLQPLRPSSRTASTGMPPLNPRPLTQMHSAPLTLMHSAPAAWQGGVLQPLLLQQSSGSLVAAGSLTNVQDASPNYPALSTTDSTPYVWQFDEAAAPLMPSPIFPGEPEPNYGYGYSQAALMSPQADTAAAVPQPTLDPKTYYESTQPSGWRPEDGGSCSALYRRAYGRHADWMLPPVWLALVGVLCYGQLLPFWALLLVAAASFLVGVYGIVVRCTGTLSSELGATRVLPSLVVCMQLLYPGVYVYHMLQPYMLATPSGLALLMGLLLLPVLHLRAALMDPGYVRPESADNGHTSGNAWKAGSGDDDEEQGVGLITSPRSSGGATLRHDATAGADGTSARGNARIGSSSYSGGSNPEVGSATACWTCGVERPLRSKHCPFCRCCVDRFDHHCPVIFNCVGAKNQRAFLTYLAVAAATQTLFIRAGAAGMTAAYLTMQQAAAAATATTTAAAAGPVNIATTGSSLSVLVRALWAARLAAPGLLLLTLLQVPFVCAVLYWLMRGLLLAAANLTTNELLNRKRYLYLQHETAGFCNRFDRGPVANCIEFWTPGHRNWWRMFEQGDREMQRAGMTVLRTRSATLFIRWFELSWGRLQATLVESRARQAKAREARRLRALGLREPAAGSSSNGARDSHHQYCNSCDHHV